MHGNVQDEDGEGIAGMGLVIVHRIGHQLAEADVGNVAVPLGDNLHSLIGS